MTEHEDKQATPAPISPELRRRLITLADTERACDERARFQPYLAVQSERSCPSPIFIVAFTGVATWKKVALPDGFEALDLTAQLRLAGETARNHYQAKNGSCGPFGKITGYALARTFDDWIGLDVDGEIVQRSIPPVRWGEATLRCEGQVLLRNGKYMTSAAPAGADSDELDGQAAAATPAAPPAPPVRRTPCGRHAPPTGPDRQASAQTNGMEVRTIIDSNERQGG